jgi:hypothetical protein
LIKRKALIVKTKHGMGMKKNIFLILLLVAQAIFISCESGLDEQATPGKRDYTWKEDSLHISFNVMEKIWGDSPTNVWAVGAGGGSSTTTWRYDGISWSTDNEMKTISPHGVWGFGNDDVWMCGREGRIWRYIGSKWQQSIWFTKNNWDIGFQEIWGDDPDNVFAVGYADSGGTRHAEMLRWNGLQWNEVQIQNYNTYNFIKIRRARNSSGDYFLLGWGESSTGGDMLALFEYDGKKMWKIYEDKFVSETWCNLEYLGNELYFLIGNKICKYENGKFNKRVEINIQNYGQAFWGRNEKDIIIAMIDGIAHYNGTDIQYLYYYTCTENAMGVVLLDKDVFILEQDYYNNFLTIIKRGTLP